MPPEAEVTSFKSPISSPPWGYICIAPGHEHEYKLLSLLGMNDPGLSDYWFWWVGSVVRKFYWLEASLKGSSLERFLMFNVHK